MGNRPISQPENAMRMQDRSAIEDHTGFAIVAIAMERQTWFTFPQKWCSAGTNDTPPLTRILVSALSAGFCTGNASPFSNYLSEKFRLSYSCVRTHNSQVGRTGKKSGQKMSSALEVYQISFGLGIRFWKWTTENMQWALLRPHCHHGLIHAGTGWVLAALRALLLLQISKNAYSSVSRRAESTCCAHLCTEVWRYLFSFSIKNWRLLPMSKTAVFWAWVAHGPFQAATPFGCNQYWLWVAYIHFWKLLYSRSFQTYWMISAVPPISPRPHFRFCWVPHLKKKWWSHS